MLEIIGFFALIIGIVIALNYYVEDRSKRDRETELIREKYSKIVHLRLIFR